MKNGAAIKAEIMWKLPVKIPQLDDHGNPAPARRLWRDRRWWFWPSCWHKHTHQYDDLHPAPVHHLGAGLRLVGLSVSFELVWQ